MGEEEEAKKEQQKQEEQDASKKALKTGAKAVDLASKTKLGDAVLNTGAKALNKVPGVGQAANAANKSGALDAADKAVDATSGGSEVLNQGGKGLENFSDIPAVKSDAGSSEKQEQATPFSSTGDNDSGEEDTDENNSLDILGGSSSKKNSKKKIMITSVLSLSGFVLITVIIVSIVYAPIYGANEFLQGLVDGIVDFFTTDQQELEEEFYQELKDVQQEINKKDHVCIDINLITAALTVYRTFDETLEDGTVNDPSGEEEIITNVDGSTTSIPYKQMKKQIKLLANMQIKRKVYGWDKSLIEANGTHCHDGSVLEEVLVTADTEDNFIDDGILFFKENGVDSSTPELIAQHDIVGFKAFFTKKSSEEKNYAYYLYRPPFTYKEIKDSAGNVIRREQICDYTLPHETAELSINSYEHNTESVFYWNLVNSFIPDYYDEYLPDDEPERTKKIKEIADDIYLLYEDLGPSQTCSISYVGPSTLCPNGITVEGVGTLDLEDYVAGVVSNEAYTSEGMEALKAQAVAARTYALKTTDYCQKSIANSTNAQTFTRNINDRARQATKETMGEVLTYNGDIFSAQYDSFCYEDSDCPDATRNSDGTYSVTYTKVPGGERHTIILSDSAQYGRITHGQGHAHGMSQLVSYQLAKEGKSYQDILTYFYSEGTDITFIEPIGGSGSVIADGSVQEKLAYLFPSGLPSSSTEASRYMTTVEFPVVDINGNRSTKKATVHQALAQDFVDIMTEISNSGFPIKDVGCYNWRSAAGSTSRSHHSYGVACDLNSNENYMIKNGQVLAGSYYKPGVDPYSFPANGVVVRTFAKYGWTWGGSWNSSKDYMHFSFTGY